MNDARSFRASLYLLVILGISGFAYALEAPALWVIACIAVLLNAWLVNSDRFRPMPRLLANGVTVLGVIFLLTTAQRGTDPMIFVVGQFLVLLQIVKLYERRTNRDYAQILVLNLLQMVAAAISTAGLLFGIILILYLFIAIYCCLLFHLKMETDALAQSHRARARQAPPQVISAAARDDQRRIGRSLRRMAGMISVVGMLAAVFMFFFFPRSSSSGIFSPLQLRPNEALTGFTDSVSFQNLAMITQNTQTIAWVKADRDGRPYAGTLLLRGLTLDHYSGKSADRSESDYQWTRSVPRRASELSGSQWQEVDPVTPDDDLVHQEVTLYPTGTNALFALGGVVRFKPELPARYRYWRSDEVIQATEPLNRRITYEVTSRERLTSPVMPPIRSPNPSQIDRRIEEFARRVEVSGTDDDGALAPRRAKDAPVSALDSTIARQIETYLRTNFAYTLDLTDASRIEDQDPLVAFLYDLKRGHCEYFAGAMALMCQSLGMQARMVVGFRCDEYNPMAESYNVRQSHAHAWVEVLDDQGVWRTYDPTSSNEIVVAQADSWLAQFRALFGYLEYAWENAVIAYDQTRQGNVVLYLDQAMRRVAEAGQVLLQGFPRLSFNILGALIALVPLVFVVPVVWFLVAQWRLRRRARRIGLDALPPPEQMKLARQLGFYDELIRLLERYRIVRPVHLTPMEFSRTLTFLPTDVFGSIQNLTDLFYRVRFGRLELNPQQARELDSEIQGVAVALNSAYH